MNDQMLYWAGNSGFKLLFQWGIKLRRQKIFILNTSYHERNFHKTPPPPPPLNGKIHLISFISINYYVIIFTDSPWLDQEICKKGHHCVEMSNNGCIKTESEPVPAPKTKEKRVRKKKITEENEMWVDSYGLVLIF